jgi:hypothetical protein
MKAAPPRPRWPSLPNRSPSLAFLFSILLLLQPHIGRGQLAITEVMSNASATTGVEYPDFWELTNLGTNTIELTGYKFYDRGDVSAAHSQPFNGVRICPSESIVFVRQDTNGFPNAEQFRQWWGLTNMEVQIITVPRDFFPGFSQVIDAVQLWDRDNNLIDKVEWADAPQGSTFVYDAATGNFPVTSEVDVCHAWVAPGTGEDVGSPGTNCGPVVLRFIIEPQDIVVDGGRSLVLRAAGAGFPRPRFQWFFDGALMSEQNNATLSLPSVTPDQAGNYFVVMTNGLTSMTSGVARVTVNTNPSPCELVRGLNDLTVTLGQQPVLSIETRGYPLCDYQWHFEGAELPGATNSTFELDPTEFSDSGTYSVVASNALGTCRSSAVLTVTRKPLLLFSEIMAAPSTGHADWFELTNYDTNAVPIRGYRFDDEPGTFYGAYTITNEIEIMPGESIILVERITPSAFRQWWGAENLPSGLKIVQYGGFGLSEIDDFLTLWNATASNRFDRIDNLSYAWAPPTNTFAVPTNRPADLETSVSVVGQGGAFCAVEGGDIGSPGYVTNPPPRITAIRSGNDTIIRWRAPAGTSCRLEAGDALTTASWTSIQTFVADCYIMSATNSTAGRQRFYRLAPPR